MSVKHTSILIYEGEISFQSIKKKIFSIKQIIKIFLFIFFYLFLFLFFLFNNIIFFYLILLFIIIIIFF